VSEPVLDVFGCPTRIPQVDLDRMPEDADVLVFSLLFRRVARIVGAPGRSLTTTSGRLRTGGRRR
jgi:hypothetical protein